jgi:drug/metabolite transporter (DMT)-like permease
MQNDRLKIIGGFILASTIWGSTWLAIKIGLGSIPPFFGAAFRFLIAMIVLLAVIKFRGIEFQNDKKSQQLYLISGLMAFGIPFALVYWGQQYIPSGLSSILFALYPFIVGILSHVMLPSEPLNVFKVSGILLGFFGIFIVFSQDIAWGGDSTSLGMLAIVLSSILQGFSLILIKKYGKHLNPFNLNLGGMTIGAMVLFCLALIFESPSDVHFDLKGVGSILYLGVLGSVVTFSVYFWMLKKVEAVYLSLLAFVTPILAIILGGIVLNEKLGVHVLQGGALVLLGILVANSKDFLKSVYKKKGIKIG